MPIVPLPADIERFRGLPATLWGRVSGKIQESDGYSLPNQQREAREAAALLGVNIVSENFEQGSGRDWELAGINAELRRIKSGEIKAIILKNVSRLARSSGKQAWIEHLLDEAGALIWYYDETYEDNAAGRLKRAIMADVAEFMLDQAREDSMRARYEKVEQFGRPVGNGPLPYGWERVIDRSGARPRTVGYRHHPEQAAVVRRLRELRTLSPAQLAARFEAEGIPAPASFRPSERRPYAGRWESHTIRHILANRMIWGEYRYGERERYRVNGKWRQRPKKDARITTLQFEPILEQAEVEELRAIVSGRHRRHTTAWAAESRDGDPFVLRGMLVCGRCGSRLRTQTVTGRARTGGRDRYYWCPRKDRKQAERAGAQRCTLPPVAADRVRRGSDGGGIEDLVWSAVDAFFRDEYVMRETIAAARASDTGAIEHAERLAFVRARLTEQKAAHQRATDRWSEADDPLDRDSFEATRQRLRREIASSERDLRELEATVPRGIGESEEAALLTLGRDVRAALAVVTDADRQALMAELGLVVTVTEAPNGTAVGRHRYLVEVTALGTVLRSSGRDNLTRLSLCLLHSDAGPSLRAAG